MKPKKLMIYLTLFVAAALFYYVYEVRLGAQKASEKEAAIRIFNLAADQVQGLRYAAGEREYVMIAQGPDAWLIKEPVDTPADRWTVEGLVRTAMDGVRRRRFIPDAGQLEAYGLVRPEITLTLLGTDPTGGADSYRALAPTLALGGENPAGDSRYARLGHDSTEIFTVSNEYYRDLNKSLYDLRDKSLVLFPGEKIDRLRLSCPGEVVLEKRSLRTWEITSPRQGPADNDVVQRLVYSGLKGRVARFDLREGGERDLGFDRPLVRIEVMSAGKRVADLVVGRPFGLPDKMGPASLNGAKSTDQPPGAWVKSSERAEVMLVGSKMAASLGLGYDDLRDRHVLPLNRRMLTELKITNRGLVFKAVKQDAVWRVVEPPDGASRDMDIESFLMAVEDLKYVRLVDEDGPGIDFSPDVVVEMVGLDEQTRIMKMDLTRTQERYIPVRIGVGSIALVLFDDLAPKLPVEVRPGAVR